MDLWQNHSKIKGELCFFGFLQFKIDLQIHKEEIQDILARHGRCLRDFFAAGSHLTNDRWQQPSESESWKGTCSGKKLFFGRMFHLIKTIELIFSWQRGKKMHSSKGLLHVLSYTSKRMYGSFQSPKEEVLQQMLNNLFLPPCRHTYIVSEPFNKQTNNISRNCAQHPSSIAAFESNLPSCPLSINLWI